MIKLFVHLLVISVFVKRFLLKALKGRNIVENQCIKRRRILKQRMNVEGRRIWNNFICLRERFSGGFT
jgi:hypothetical protein